MTVSDTVTSGNLLLAAPLAGAAGLVSFLSPCVLPLVPGYLSYVTGLSGEEMAGRRARVLVGAVLFVLGFTAVFVSYGALFGGIGRQLTLHERTLQRVLGAVTIVLGLAFVGMLRPASRTWRPLARVNPGTGLLAAPVLGVLFGIGWTPCVGPTLAAVQGLALDAATAQRGALLSAAYCLGLGLPFLVAGVLYRGALGAFGAVRRRAGVVTAVGGLMLITLGVLQITGAWAEILARLQGTVASTGTIL